MKLTPLASLTIRGKVALANLGALGIAFLLLLLFDVDPVPPLAWGLVVLLVLPIGFPGLNVLQSCACGGHSDSQSNLVVGALLTAVISSAFIIGNAYLWGVCYEWVTRQLRRSRPRAPRVPTVKPLMRGPIIVCPHCETRVLPVGDGTCPQCGARFEGWGDPPSP